MAKLIFVLLLCGFSVSSASPTCTNSEARACIAGPVLDEYPKTEKEMVTFCRALFSELDCQIEYIDRCPDTLLGTFGESVQMTKELYVRICKKDSPLGEMFIASSQCYEDEVEAADLRCGKEVAEENYCLALDFVQKCVIEDLMNVCGEDSKELYAEMVKVKLSLKYHFCMPDEIDINDPISV